MRIKTGKDLRVALLDYFAELQKQESRKYRIGVGIIVTMIVLVFMLGIDSIVGELSLSSIIINGLGAVIFFLFSVGIIIFFITLFIAAANLHGSIEDLSHIRFLNQVFLKRIHQKISNTEVMIRDGVCSFNINFDKKYYIVEFFTPSKNLIHDMELPRQLIEDAINRLIPYSVDLKKYIVINGLQPSFIDENELLDDKIEKIIVAEISRKVKYLDSDVKNKGIEMSKVYYYLYCLENAFREFIDLRSKLYLGEDYKQKIFISKSIIRKIELRKANEKKFKYIAFRGENFLFYLDFKELGDVIINNPYLLNSFPDEIWVKSKINEMGNIRNLIAHNSYVGKHELDIIKVTFQSVLMQFDK